MRQFDPVVTHIMDRFSTEFAKLLFDEPDLKVIQRLDTKQATIKVHQNDLTFKVQHPNGEVMLFHFVRAIPSWEFSARPATFSKIDIGGNHARIPVL